LLDQGLGKGVASRPCVFKLAMSRIREELKVNKQREAGNLKLQYSRLVMNNTVNEYISSELS
jgi:hypothetical protein